MVRKFLLVFLFLISVFPSALFAEETGDTALEAMCRQVLSSEFSLSPKVILEAAKEKVVELPKKILDKATGTLSRAPEALVETLESMKVSSSKPLEESLTSRFSPQTNSDTKPELDNGA